jgi:anaerobic selenocysteine-containing dehydrogenase
MMVHPEDARSRGIEQGDLVEVNSPRGKIQVEASITEKVTSGLVAIDFGWGNPTDRKANVNVLVNDEVWDPISGGYPTRLFVCEIRSLLGEKI